MNYPVDTHLLLWSLFDPSKIKQHIAELLTEPQTIKYASRVSFWEIALKYSIGKLTLEGTSPEGVLQAPRKSGFKVLDIGEEDLATSHLLPLIENHKDPFDRLIGWQCIRNDIVVVTADIRLRGYESYGLKLSA